MADTRHHSSSTKTTASMPAAAVQRNTKSITVRVEDSPTKPRPSEPTRNVNDDSKSVLNRGEPLADDAGQVSDEGRQRDSGRDILVADRDQEPDHAVVGAECADQAVEPERVGEGVDAVSAFGEVGIDEIAERRDRGADQTVGKRPMRPNR